MDIIIKQAFLALSETAFLHFFSGGRCFAKLWLSFQNSVQFHITKKHKKQVVPKTYKVPTRKVSNC